jgi:hypothetical protein
LYSSFISIEIAKIMQMNNILEYCRKFEIGEMEDNQKNLPNGVYTPFGRFFTASAYPTLSPLPSIWISIICGVFCENALG